MQNIKILNDTLTVSFSNLTEGDVRKVANYEPKAFELRDKDNKCFFRLDLILCGADLDLSKYGVEMRLSNNDKSVLSTTYRVYEPVEFIKHNPVIFENIALVEAQIEDELKSINKRLAKLEKQIEVIELTNEPKEMKKKGDK